MFSLVLLGVTRKHGAGSGGQAKYGSACVFYSVLTNARSGFLGAALWSLEDGGCVHMFVTSLLIVGRLRVSLGAADCQQNRFRASRVGQNTHKSEPIYWQLFSAID